MRGRTSMIAILAGLGAVLGGCALDDLGDRGSVDASLQGSRQDPLAQGRTHYASGQYGIALNYFQQALIDRPTSPEVMHALAATYEALGRQDLSQRYFDRAVALGNSGSGEARLTRTGAVSLASPGLRGPGLQGLSAETLALLPSGVSQSKSPTPEKSPEDSAAGSRVARFVNRPVPPGQRPILVRDSQFGFRLTTAPNSNSDQGSDGIEPPRVARLPEERKSAPRTAASEGAPEGNKPRELLVNNESGSGAAVLANVSGIGAGATQGNDFSAISNESRESSEREAATTVSTAAQRASAYTPPAAASAASDEDVNEFQESKPQQVAERPHDAMATPARPAELMAQARPETAASKSDEEPPQTQVSALLDAARPAAKVQQAVAAGDLEVSNGAGRRFLAARTRLWLGEQGLGQKVRITNDKTFKNKETVIFYRDGFREQAEEIGLVMPVSVRLVPVQSQRASVRVRLGKDILDFDKENLVSRQGYPK
jgi:LytR cell envelope-related transcriptional attenuator